jgi:hypothetical protein
MARQSPPLAPNMASCQRECSPSGYLQDRPVSDGGVRRRVFNVIAAFQTWRHQTRRYKIVSAAKDEPAGG